MSGMHLYSEHAIATTSVPNVFIDKYMVEANGEFVKVYLYLLRCLSDSSLSCTTSAIADSLEHTEKDVIRALKYWVRAGVLSLEMGDDKSIVGICLKDLAADNSASANAPAEAEAVPEESAPAKAKTKTRAPKAEAAPAIERKAYTLDEMKAFAMDPEVTELLFIVETYLKHPLAASDNETILFWYDQLGFSSELITYLVEYCISKGHQSMRYLDKVAINWFEKNITTVEQAKAESGAYNKTYYAVAKAFGISGRNLVERETAFVDVWTKEFGFGIEIICEACAKTIAATNQPSFEYANSILTSWHNNNVHTLEEARKISEATKPKARKAATTAKRTGFSNFSQRDYNIEDFEAALLSTSPRK